MFDQKLNWADAALYLQNRHGVKITETLLRSKHKHGTGPSFIKPNARSILFRQSDIDKWVASWEAAV